LGCRKQTYLLDLIGQQLPSLSTLGGDLTSLLLRTELGVDLLAVLTEPQEIGSEGTLGLVRVSRLSLLSHLLLGSSGRTTANGDEFARLEECAEVHHAGVEIDGTTEPSIGVINVGGGGIVEGVLEGDP
jgi:hypothetical protein